MIDTCPAHLRAPDRAELDGFGSGARPGGEPKQTRPSGLCSDPPGPAMPVTAMAIPAPERSSAPAAISRATSSDTAPWAASVACATPNIWVLAALV